MYPMYNLGQNKGYPGYVERVPLWTRLFGGKPSWRAVRTHSGIGGQFDEYYYSDNRQACDKALLAYQIPWDQASRIYPGYDPHNWS